MKYDVEKLKLSEIDNYISSEKVVRDNMEHPEWLGDFKREDYEYLLSNGILEIYTWKDNSDYVGAAMLIKLNDIDKSEYLSDELDSSKMIDFGPIWVSPQYVGQGLQVEFINYLIELVKNEYEYFVTTVAPENTHSIINFEKCNFQNIGEVELKRGKRIVLRRER